MSKKRKRTAAKRAVPKSGPVWHLSSEEATLANKPRYNGFACGHGAQGDAKYNRAKSKRAWEKRMRQEGASRGPSLCPRHVAVGVRGGMAQRLEEHGG